MLRDGLSVLELGLAPPGTDLHHPLSGLTRTDRKMFDDNKLAQFQNFNNFNFFFIFCHFHKIILMKVFTQKFGILQYFESENQHFRSKIF